MRSTATALLTVVLVGVFALDASAKGPESATLTGPGIDQPIQLIHRSVSFDTYANHASVRLIRLTGLFYGPGSDPISPPENPGPAYTLTWVNSGPPGDNIDARTIQQYVYLDAADGPLIHTPSQIGLEGWGPEVIGWFNAPAELESTIEEVIAWSTTEEAAAIQARFTPISETPDPAPAPESSSTDSTVPHPENPLMPVLLALGITGIGVLLVRQTRHIQSR
ncbi:MAG TPA: hypothetical protein VE569_12655 [Acidimicrobiia bacterium]|nr:hypothetical protein [Acidimicrobiia bacterium]